MVSMEKSQELKLHSFDGIFFDGISFDGISLKGISSIYNNLNRTKLWSFFCY